MKIEDTCLSRRAISALRAEGILRTDQLFQLSDAEIDRIDGIGHIASLEIARLKEATMPDANAGYAGPSCNNCRFAVRSYTPAAMMGLQCRHRSPGFEQEIGAWRAGWPHVLPSEWCGDYENTRKPV